MLYQTADRNEDAGISQIRLMPGAHVDGVLLVERRFSRDEQLDPSLLVEKNALIRGAVLSTHITELHGSVWGSVVTNRFIFYESPTIYINWLKDTQIRLDRRPEIFVLPLVHQEIEQLEVIYRNEQ